MDWGGTNLYCSNNLIQPEVYVMNCFIHVCLLVSGYFFFPIFAIWLEEPSAVETIPLQQWFTAKLIIQFPFLVKSLAFICDSEEKKPNNQNRTDQKKHPRQPPHMDFSCRAPATCSAPPGTVHCFPYRSSSPWVVSLLILAVANWPQKRETNDTPICCGRPNWLLVFPGWCAMEKPQQNLATKTRAPSEAQC